MRFVFLIVLGLGGCAADGLPVETGATTSAGDMAGLNARSPDMSGHGQGGSCVTACDCAAGLACLQGRCARTFLPVYCCERADACPLGQLCQERRGSFGQCGCMGGGAGGGSGGCGPQH